MNGHFSGGNPSARGKLNFMQDELGVLTKLRGDEIFITINYMGGGICVGLNINQVLARIPKYVPKCWLYVKITGATPISGQPNRWQYNWTEQTPGAAGLWVDKPSGCSSGSSGYGYNSMEANNSSAGIQGNGIDLASLPAGSALLPIRGNPVVFGELLADCTGAKFLSFEAVNQTQCGS